MLKEFKSVTQKDKKGYRRWFDDEYFDLIVWYDRAGKIEGFQLCYDKFKDEHAITWRSKSGFSHDRIDDGENFVGSNMTPILVSDGQFPYQEIIRRFEASSERIDPQVASFVLEQLRKYPSS